VIVRVLAVAFGDLVSVVGVSLGAGVVVTAAFAFVVLESGRSGEARRSGNSRAATLHAALAALFFIAFAVIVIYGVVIMLSKG
jgi:hypothetical protein